MVDRSSLDECPYVGLLVCQMRFLYPSRCPSEYKFKLKTKMFTSHEYVLRSQMSGDFAHRRKRWRLDSLSGSVNKWAVTRNCTTVFITAENHILIEVSNTFFYDHYSVSTLFYVYVYMRK